MQVDFLTSPIHYDNQYFHRSPMKALLLLGSVLLILLLAGLWVGNGSYPDRWRMQEEIKTQKAANKLQTDKNRRIRAELDDVASGNDAIEERARSELGMTRKGETFYEVVLQPEVIKKKEIESQKVQSEDDQTKQQKAVDVNTDVNDIEKVEKKKHSDEQASD